MKRVGFLLLKEAVFDEIKKMIHENFDYNEIDVSLKEEENPVGMKYYYLYVRRKHSFHGYKFIIPFSALDNVERLRPFLSHLREEISFWLGP
ncbi:MAG: hypothetical protein ACXQS8_06485 [Candidatus Helarchaeales archaeon]